MTTSEDIENAIFKHLNAPAFAQQISGDVCKKKRTKNSHAEDAVIVVIANDYAQKQTVDVSVNVYVQDLMVNGQYEADNKRINTLKKIAEEHLNALRIENAYRKLVSQNTLESAEIGEHIISNRLVINIVNE